jgi:magnesium chelatase family protein
MDRIDLHVEVPRLPPNQLNDPAAAAGETSAAVRRRVEAARALQLARASKPNQALTPREIDHYCRLDESGHQLMDQALQRLGLSARAYHRVLKAARTIADLAGSETIGTEHLSEAIGYRRLDRAQR